MAAQGVGFSEWMDELQRLWASSGGEGLTSEELAEQLGVSEKTALRYLGLAKKQGWRVSVNRRRTTTLDGRPAVRPEYMLHRPAAEVKP